MLNREQLILDLERYCRTKFSFAIENPNLGPTMEADRNITQRIILSASVPDRKELCCVFTLVDPENARDSSAINDYDYRMMKCRLLIYRMPEVIASPFHETKRDVCIIMNKEFHKGGELQKELMRNNLKISDPQKVTLEAYEACLRFTTLCRLTPSWNKTALYLLQGTFIMSTEIITAIQLNLSVYDGRIYFELWPNRVNIPFIKLGDPHHSQNTIAEFMADPNGYIDMTPFDSMVHVLPSLKEGKVIGISKKLPETYPFQNYQSLRTQWKNEYGYHLPNSEEGIIYYHIRMLGSYNSFIYPSICVRSNSLILVRGADHEATTNHFLRLLKKSVPTICSRSIQFNLEKALKESDAENEPTQCVAPSAGKIFCEREASAKTLQDKSSMHSNRNSFSGSQINLSKKDISSSEICNTHLSSGIISKTISSISSLMGDAMSPSKFSDKIVSENMHSDDVNQLSDTESMLKSNRHRRIRPDGNNVADPWTPESQHSPENYSNQIGNNKPLDPIQIAKNEISSKSSFLNGINNLPKRDKELRLNNFTELAQANKTPTKMEEDYVDDFPLFVSLTELNSRDEEDSECKMGIENIRFKNPSQLVSSPTFFQYARASDNYEESSKKGMKFPTKVYRNPRQKIALLIEPIAENRITPVAVQQNEECVRKFFKTKRSLRIDNNFFRKSVVPKLSNKRKNFPKKESVETILSAKHAKRNDEVKLPTENKRKKVAHVQDVNIQQMAMDNNLKDVNVVTLRHWLTEHSVPWKTREKKIELIAKVVDYFHQNRKFRNFQE